MKPQTVAFAEANASLCRMGIPEILPALHEAEVRISRVVLGGSHSVAIYPPIDSLIPMEALDIGGTIDCGSDASLYVHIPFCETRCTFCHYVVEHYAGPLKSSEGENGKVARYLEALKRELASWGMRLAQSGTVLSSIYIGGGTPLILEKEALQDLMRTIQQEFDIVHGAEICIEGSPLTIAAADGEEKLWFLKELGVTRLSFGVQSFDDTVLKHAGRCYTREVPIWASHVANQVFENWNLDLIQGLYEGSPLETWDNLQVIADICPPHLTWYHGRFAERRPQSNWYRAEAKRDRFEAEQETLLGRMLIWQEMAALGYCQIDGNRFVRKRQFIDPFKEIRTSARSTLLGLGTASYSHTRSTPESSHRGYVFRNESNIRLYEEKVLAGRTPIATGRIINEEEVLSMSYATGLRTGRFEDADLQSIRRQVPDLARHFEGLVHRLCELGLLETFASNQGAIGLRLSRLGRLFEDEILALFFSPDVKASLVARKSRALESPRLKSQSLQDNQFSRHKGPKFGP